MCQKKCTIWITLLQEGSSKTLSFTTRCGSIVVHDRIFFLAEKGIRSHAAEVFQLLVTFVLLVQKSPRWRSVTNHFKIIKKNCPSYFMTFFVLNFLKKNLFGYKILFRHCICIWCWKIPKLPIKQKLNRSYFWGEFCSFRFTSSFCRVWQNSSRKR